MDEISALTSIDYTSFILTLFILLMGLYAVISLVEKVSDKIGLEFSWMRKKKEERRLLLATSQALRDFKTHYRESEEKRDRQIEALMQADREALGDRIHQKYKCYIKMNGIPEDEIDEFTHLHDAYKAVGGNHSGDAKYSYCINHLPILPAPVHLPENTK